MLNLFSIKKLARLGGLIALALIVFVPSTVLAQSLNLDLAGPSTTSRVVQITLLITILSLAPSILVMVTSFTRIVVVLSLLRSAIGVQNTPPNVVLISLALFLTLFVMQPTFERAWEDGVRPYMNNEVDEAAFFDRTLEPFQTFMLKNTREKDLDFFLNIAKVDLTQTGKGAPNKDAKGTANAESHDKDVPLRALIPSFMLSELRRAFEIGFLIFLPFLIIDMVIASMLMSMGMMMLPPSAVSMPFKIIFFVLVDGWLLIAGSLVQSYGL
jgi:flagellar biosynthetic protein FliP